MSTWGYVRIADLVMAVGVIVIFSIVVHRRVKAKDINAPELLFRTGIVVYLGATAYATAENLHQRAPGGVRLIFLSIGLLWMLLAIIRIERNQRKPK